MLFYETEGEFGEPNFKITARELFPLDIGSQAYTEYETNDPELIKFLMANPHVRGMKKGHIHSHNNMPVFFSGTDDGELQDNSVFHNFYLSLIVNNKNEMCAKIAFKAKAVSETVTTLTFKDQEGKDKDKKYTSSKEDECIYTYSCDISIPGGVEDSFKNRFQYLKTDKEKKEEAKKTSEHLVRNQAFQSLPIDPRYRQHGLFDDIKGSNSYSAKSSENRVGFQTNADKAKVDTGTERNNVVERGRVGLVASRIVYSMLGKLLAQDFLYEGTLTHILRKMDNEFYDETGLDPMQSVSATIYFENVERRATEFYIDSFPEDQKMEGFDETMQKCIEVLETYADDYPFFIKELRESLNLELR